MFLRRIQIHNFKVLRDIDIRMENRPEHRVFPVVSFNGTGKSTLLQLVFILLHCSFDDKRKRYVRNLLYNLQGFEKTEVRWFANFTIEHHKKIFELEYIISKLNFGPYNFNCFLDETKLQNEVSQNERLRGYLSSLVAIKKEIQETRRVTTVRHIEIGGHVETDLEKELFYNIKKKKGVGDYKKLIKQIQKRFETELLRQEKIKKLLLEHKKEKENLEKLLQSVGLYYVMHLDDKKVLLYRSQFDQAFLREMSEHVVLILPDSQPLLFLTQGEKQSIFDGISRNQEQIEKVKANLSRFFTYEMVTNDLIIEFFKRIRDEDFGGAINYGNYGNRFQEAKKELKELLIDKEIVIDKELSHVFFKSVIDDCLFTLGELSHGELRKLGVFIWLKMLPVKNAMILMDEVDAALHPAWQHQITRDLQDWSKESQFLLATHSPQIMNSAHYKSLVTLEKKQGQATSKQYHHPPVEEGLNMLLKTIINEESLNEEKKPISPKKSPLF